MYEKLIYLVNYIVLISLYSYIVTYHVAVECSGFAE